MHTPNVTYTEADPLLTRREAAKYLRVAETTLQRWAREGRDPKPVRLHRRVLYPLSRLQAALKGD